MKILVTGGSGFIGKPLIKKIVEGKHAIMALSRYVSELEKKDHFENIQWVKSSLQLEKETFDLIKDFKPDAIIHLAWGEIPDFSFETSLANLQNQALFFDKVCKIPSVKKIIVAGSSFEYNQVIGKCLESDKCISTNYFTWAKNALRDLLRVECLQKNISLVWVRIFYVYGPNQRSESLIPTVIRSLLDGNVPELKKPANSNDFVYVDDVAEGLKRMVEKDINSGIYNLGTGKSVQVIEILRIIEKTIGNSAQISLKAMQNAQNLDKETDFWADMTKTRENLVWQPATPIEEGIKYTINSIINKKGINI